MHRIIRLRPTPAMVVATIALLVALGGTSVAAVGRLAPANSVGTAAVIDGSLLAKDLKPGVIPSQGALAYAHVSEDGILDAANSKNVAVIPAKNDDKGAFDYCLDVTAKQAPRTVVATLESFASLDRQIVAFMRPALVAPRCQGKADAVVETAVAGNFDQRHSFYVVFN
ncbi:MAG TPA: hypothetical protein VH816_13820 [Gaiellaceae bacterium]|jgi:hypothetical protein